MQSKVFVFGRPGSGKTTAAMAIKNKVEAETQRSVFYTTDYPILYNMYLAESREQRAESREAKAICTC